MTTFPPARCFGVCLLLFALLPAEAQQRGPPATASSRATTVQRGTDTSPLVVKLANTGKSEQDRAADAQQMANAGTANRWAVILSLLSFASTLALIVVALLQWRTLNAQKTAMIEQADQLRASVNEAKKATAATERASYAAERSAMVASETVGVMTQQLRAMELQGQHLAETILQMRGAEERELRAYVSVVVWNNEYQERDKNIRFAGHPKILNTGRTPAHNVRHQIRAGILPVPLPSGFEFPLPGEPTGAAVLGPQQEFIMSALLDDFVPDAEVDRIKRGDGHALYVWGVVSYEDVFGVHRRTNFSQILVFIPIPFGYFTEAHNDAT